MPCASQTLMPSIVHSRYLDLCRRNHSINLTRGRPAEEFLDLASGLGSALPEDLQIDGKDLRNYIGFPGLPAARELGAALLKAPADRVLVGDNSSMNLLNWVLTMLWFRGINGCAPWREHESVACLCPVPGYDRWLEPYGWPTLDASKNIQISLDRSKRWWV